MTHVSLEHKESERTRTSAKKKEQSAILKGNILIIEKRSRFNAITRYKTIERR